MIDEATATITGKIPFTSGMPRRTSLSRDRTRFYTVEAQHGEGRDHRHRVAQDDRHVHAAARANSKVRIKSARARSDAPLRDDGHPHRAPKHIDRWEIGPSALVQYDLAHAQDRAHASRGRTARSARTPTIQFSPDGKLMYLFSEQDVLIYETTDVHAGRQVGALEAGRGGLRRASSSVRSTPSTTSPASTPRIFTRAGSGAEPPHDGHRPRQPGGQDGRLLHPRSGDAGRASRWRPSRKVAYGLMSARSATTSSGSSTSRDERVAARAEFEGRPRMSLEDQLERQGALHLQRRRDDRPLRRRRPSSS